MPIEDFSFTNQSKASISDRQAVLSLSDEKDRESATKVLKKMKYHLLGESQDLKEIVELLRKHKRGVYILDYDISSLDTEDLITKVKSNCPGFRVILAANTLSKEQIEHAKSSGIVAFLAKPLSKEAIVKVMSKPLFK